MVAGFRRLSPRHSNFLWLLSGTVTGGLLTVVSWYVLTYTWVPFQPICSFKHRKAETFIESVVTRPFRFLNGRLRDDFKRKALQNIFGESRVTPDGIFVTIEYFQDLNSYWNYTLRAVRHVAKERISVSRDFKWERNRRIHDGDPQAERKARERWEVAQIGSLMGDENWRRLARCDVVRYFAIEGAPLPKFKD